MCKSRIDSELSEKAAMDLKVTKETMEGEWMRAFGSVVLKEDNIMDNPNKEVLWVAEDARDTGGKHEEVIDSWGERQVVDAIVAIEALDYDKVKAAILKMLDVSEEAYHWKFGELRVKAGGNPRAVAQFMKANLLRWLKPTERSAYQLVVLIVLEQLVATLSASQKNWVIRHQAASVEEAVSLLEAFNAAEMNTGSSGMLVVELINLKW
ncbi:hypothetical protein JRQ81_007069 [Phrynocephalus forsythii]|uniref:SCAN box domain-containing protein n=1 Tax=Phrynocephalus forsythii TaxID=171643 RepID=A0A9Q0Y3N1_9SAUR|nr:hypothetical protein JRQ81_007069 [Phrynocephalus forsythii]